MSEALFKIGSVYRQKNGRIMRLYPGICMDMDGREIAHVKDVGRDAGQGHRLLSTGAEWDLSMLSHNRDLIPGELHQIDGQWLPITEQPRSPYFAEAVGEKPEAPKTFVKRVPRPGMVYAPIDPNAAMIARDGEPKPVTATTPIPAQSTALPALAGLLRVADVSHQLGSVRF